MASGGWLVFKIRHYSSDYYFWRWVIGKERLKNPWLTLSNLTESILDPKPYVGLEITIQTLNADMAEYEVCFTNTGKYELRSISVSKNTMIDLLAPGYFALSKEEKGQFPIVQIDSEIMVKKLSRGKHVVLPIRGIRGFTPSSKWVDVWSIVNHGRSREMRLYSIFAKVAT